MVRAALPLRATLPSFSTRNKRNVPLGALASDPRALRGCPLPIFLRGLARGPWSTHWRKVEAFPAESPLTPRLLGCRLVTRWVRVPLCGHPHHSPLAGGRGGVRPYDSGGRACEHDSVPRLVRPALLGGRVSRGMHLPSSAPSRSFVLQTTFPRVRVPVGVLCRRLSAMGSVGPKDASGSRCRLFVASGPPSWFGRLLDDP